MGHAGCLDGAAHGLMIFGINGQGTKALRYLITEGKQQWEC